MSERDATGHPWAELAAAHALDALDDAERAGFEAHLATCGGCRDAVTAHRAVAARLALGAPAAAPPPALRARILAEARQVRPIGAGSAAAAGAMTGSPAAVSSRDASVQTATGGSRTVRPRASALAPWLAAAAALLVAVGAGAGWWRERAARLGLEATAVESRATLAVRDSALAARDSLLATLLAPDVSTARLAATGTGPSARVYWNQARGVVVLTTAELPPAPQGRTYQVWGIRTGEAPVSLGTFDGAPDGRGRVVIAVPRDAAMDVVAVTEEPAGGSVRATTAPFLVGSLERE